MTLHAHVRTFTVEGISMRHFAVALFFIVFATTAAAQPPSPGTFRVHAIDVGSGLSIFVEGADFTLLYDAGSSDDTPPGRGNRVLAYLRAVRPDLRRIDHVILSHPHLDHLSLMPDLLSAYEVSNVWDAGAVNPLCAYRLLLERVADNADITYHHAAGGPGPHDASFPAQNCSGRSLPPATISLTRGIPITREPVRLGERASISILSGDGTIGVPNLHAGNLVVRLDLGSRRVLLPGDAEAGRRLGPQSPPDPGSTEARLLECCAADIRADVLVSPHHGSKTSSRSAFLDAVGATIYVVSVGPRLFAGVINPDADVMREYLLRGSLWRTDINDYGCALNPAKIGPDNDGKPGGCDNIRIFIDETGAMTPAYDNRAD
ncbi:MAG: ComEC/Rec2 family competence protein [Allosphingosinicella sp.]